MDAPYYNGGPDDGRFRKVSRVQRSYGKGYCRRCSNAIHTPIYIERFGDVCSFVCASIVRAQMELAKKETA